MLSNFGLIFKSLTKQLMALNWSRSTTPLLIDASSRKNRSEYPHEFYMIRNYNLCKHFLLLKVQEYLYSHSHS